MTETSTPTKFKLAKNKKYMLVRYGRMNNLGFFEHNEAHVPKKSVRVIVKSEKGMELGYLVGQLTSYKDGRFKLSEEQICEYYSNSEIDFTSEPAGKFIRFATNEDTSEEEHLRLISKEEVECCERYAKELELDMKIVEAEHIFGGERIIFYFMAEGRIDFRELVKKLAQEYQTRIEMRQIGARDEAKLLGDIESCGQPCCCIRFLQMLKPVNMRMAKVQKATLDPAKISGYCGRLKCCLRYEDQTYTDLKRQLPKKNSLVKTSSGKGKVIDGQILTQLVVVELEGGERVAAHVDEIEILEKPESTKKKKKTDLGQKDDSSIDDNDIDIDEDIDDDIDEEDEDIEEEEINKQINDDNNDTSNRIKE